MAFLIGGTAYLLSGDISCAFSREWDKVKDSHTPSYRSSILQPLTSLAHGLTFLPTKVSVLIFRAALLVVCSAGQFLTRLVI